MIQPIFSIIEYQKLEYAAMVQDFFNNPSNAHIPHQTRIEQARELVREYFTLKAKLHLEELDRDKFNEGFE